MHGGKRGGTTTNPRVKRLRKESLQVRRDYTRWERRIKIKIRIRSAAVLCSVSTTLRSDGVPLPLGCRQMETPRFSVQREGGGYVYGYVYGYYKG